MGAAFDELVIDRRKGEVTPFLSAVRSDITEMEFTTFRSRETTQGAWVGLKGQTKLVPLGQLGGGVTRIAQIAQLALITKEGFLLLDELDTGLHYSHMVEIWKMLIESASVF